MQRLLPPLLVLAVFLGVAWRCAQEPARGEARTRIAGMLVGGDVAGARAQLAAYLERYGDAEDVWFGARTWFRLGEPRQGVALVWDDPALAARPGTARRFAEMALFALGWEDEARQLARPLEPLVLLALVDGDNAWAIERLREHASTLDLTPSTLYFFPAFQQSTRKPLRLIVEAFRSRQDDHFRVARAIGALEGEAYPEEQEDIDRLIEVVASREWRRQFLDVWYGACLALGRSGKPRALEALVQAQAQLEGSSRPRDRQDELLVRVGRIAGGDWSADEPVARNALGAEPNPSTVAWYMEALIHRYRLGDKRCELGMRKLWEGPGTRFSNVRPRIARALLLQDEPPSPDAVATWVGRMLADLEAPGADRMSHALARAYRLRSREPGAREAILDLLRGAGADLADRGRDAAAAAEPYLEALRALYLYD